MRRIGIIVVFAAVWMLPVTAMAHPMLDRAVAAYEAADFERALRTFDTASRNADLTVEELLQLFEMRALVHHALGDEASMRADLERLVAVRSSYQLSRLAPPSVRNTYDAVRAQYDQEASVELRIEEKRIEGAPWVVASVLRVPDGLVDHTTLQCSVEGNARTVSRTSRGTTVSVKLPGDGAHHGCAATARTRQGGVLFGAHLEGVKSLMPSARGGRFRAPEYKSKDAGGKAKRKKWPWIVAASAVVVAGSITAGVLVSQRNKSDSQDPAGAVTVAW